MVIRLPASAVPVSVGVVSLVVLPFTSPVIGSASSTIAVMTGTCGRSSGESTTTKGTPALAFPAASVAVTVSVVGSSCAGLSAMEKLPSLPTTPVPMTVEPFVTVMMLPTSPVPVSGVPSSASSMLPGSAGATVSTVTLSGAESPEELPAGSLEETVKVCGPSNSVVSAVQLQVPPGWTVTSTVDGVPSTETITVVPGSPVPVRVGVPSFV